MTISRVHPKFVSTKRCYETKVSQEVELIRKYDIFTSPGLTNQS